MPANGRRDLIRRLKVNLYVSSIQVVATEIRAKDSEVSRMSQVRHGIIFHFTSLSYALSFRYTTQRAALCE